ncbi:MAG: DEAD/DEAH box helicase [Nanoarchaeota archaeon]|nr:DEAD/DEAH box helicase [Nanoarchaeota archaeon]
MSPEETIHLVLSANGIKTPNPVQQAAVDAGLFSHKNMIVAAPTASGKTLIAEFAAIDAVKRGLKVVYLVPLRSLASEKYADFKKKYPDIAVGMSIGDYDASDPRLGQYDIIIATSEKFDSLLRHAISWLSRVGLVVADEIHLLHDPSRGPTLEMVLTRLRQTTDARILGLSATISNHEELAAWLDAIPVKSEYRPVVLNKGVYHKNKVFFHPDREEEISSELEPVPALATLPLKQGKQSLVFLSTRKSTESVAEKLGAVVVKQLHLDEKQRLQTLSTALLKAVDRPTTQCKRLASVVKTGTAFHHAGLTNKQRGLIEDAFKQGTLKILCATPTLAAGINLPAYRVIIRDLKRFSSYKGMDYIPVLEIQQMMGRAGRPAFDTEGEAILVPKDSVEARHAWDTYIEGDPEEIASKLGVEPVLRTHVLALLASNVVTTKPELFSFFAKTFYAHQYGDLPALNQKLEKVLALLQEFGLIAVAAEPIKQGNPFRKASDTAATLTATKIGKRVSELYLDPVSANNIITRLHVLRERSLTPAGLLQSVVMTTEARPLLPIRKGDDERIASFLAHHESDLPLREPNPYDITYDDFVRGVKTVQFLLSWADESGEDVLHKTFGVAPGELRARLDIADWLLYSTTELAVLCGYQSLLSGIKRVRLRVRYGIKEELIPLIRLKGIGRVRARKLFASHIKTIADLRAVPFARLEQLLGPAQATAVKEQVGGSDRQHTLGES